MSSITKNKGDYRPEIDGLRALAVGIVVLFHANLWVPGGFIGVDVFFVISGFLITRNILAAINDGTFSFPKFYERRIRRILPASICMAVVTFCYGMIAMPDEYIRELTQSTFAHQLMFSNFYFWQTTGYFEGSGELNPFTHTWSLSVEEQFYFLYPASLVIFYRFKPRTFQLLFWSTILISLFLCEWMSRRSHNTAFYLLPFRMWELMLGGAIFFLQNIKVNRFAAEFMSSIGVLMIFLTSCSIDSKTRFPSLITLAPCMGAALFIFANTKTPTIAGQLFSKKPLVFIGQISYSLYLWHWPIFVFARFWLGLEFNVLTSLFLIGLAFVISILSWKFVETPFRESKTTNSKPPIKLKLPIATTVALAAVSICLPFAINFDFTKSRDSEFAGSLDFTQAGDSVFNGIAEVKLPQVKEGQVPKFGDHASNQVCLVWGDSHAMAFVPGIDVACKKLSICGMQATVSSTPPLMDFVRVSRFGMNDRTPEYSNFVYNLAVAKEIDYLIISGSWNDYAAVPSFEEKLFLTLKKFKEADIAVAIILDVANHQSFNPFEIRRTQGKEPFSNPKMLTFEEHRKRNRKAENAIRRAAKNLAIVIDPATMMFDEDNYWLSVANGRNLYRNPQHLSVYGGKFLTPLFTEMFQKLMASEK